VPIGNFVQSKQESASNPLLHIHKNRQHSFYVKQTTQLLDAEAAPFPNREIWSVFTSLPTSNSSPSTQ